MKFIVGDIWDYHGKRNSYIGITTNGSVKSNKCLVMGRGVALQTKEKFKGIDYLLGVLVKQFGNKVHVLASEKLFTFPTKALWFQDSTIELIDKSCQELKEYMDKLPEYTFYLSLDEDFPIEVLKKYFIDNSKLIMVGKHEDLLNR